MIRTLVDTEMQMSNKRKMWASQAVMEMQIKEQ